MAGGRIVQEQERDGPNLFFSFPRVDARSAPRSGRIFGAVRGRGDRVPFFSPSFLFLLPYGTPMGTPGTLIAFISFLHKRRRGNREGRWVIAETSAFFFFFFFFLCVYFERHPPSSKNSLSFFFPFFHFSAATEIGIGLIFSLSSSRAFS